MPLFRDHPVRSTVIFLVAVSIGHWFTKTLHSLQAFHLTQTSVAIMALASLIFLVTMHHRREGQLLNQTQEEMLIIGGFAMFWVVLAWRALSGRSGDPALGGDLDMGRVDGRREAGFTGGLRPYPCSADDIYCVVEEWSFF